jgi:pathogenicity locus Cdd1 protein
MASDVRQLKDLVSIGPAMNRDLTLLGVHSVEHLAACDALELYERLSVLTRSRQDPCVLDTFRAAIAQARDPKLPPEQKNWWYWSRLRKAGGLV